MMREVEQRLSAQPTPVAMLAQAIYGGEPTRAQLEGVRRAVRGLVVRGDAVRLTNREIWEALQPMSSEECWAIRSKRGHHRSWVRRSTPVSVVSSPTVERTDNT